MLLPIYNGTLLPLIFILNQVDEKSENPEILGLSDPFSSEWNKIRIQPAFQF